jgi:hypothetical protein
VALVDRLVHRSEILEIEGASYPATGSKRQRSVQPSALHHAVGRKPRPDARYPRFLVAANTVLTPYLVLRPAKAARASSERNRVAKSMLVWLREKLAGDAEASETLKRLEEKPDAGPRQELLAERLVLGHP